MPTVLTISGFDPSGGAGVLADVAAIRALGCQARAVITTLTVQGPGVTPSMDAVAPQLVSQQINAALADNTVKAVKIGALANAQVAAAVHAALAPHSALPIVIDPVLAATSGLQLLEAEGVDVLVDNLLPIATLVTPNLGEAAKICQLLGRQSLPDADVETMKVAARTIANLGPAVLVKGGHLRGPQLTDLLFFDDTIYVEHHTRIDISKAASRGTGCRLASAIAAELAKGHDLAQAWKLSREALLAQLSASAKL